MEQEQKKGPVDTAREPVDRNSDAEFMDTGVLHQDRVCNECGDDLASQGQAKCTDCLEEVGE